jgi:hypothetical protein
MPVTIQTLLRSLIPTLKEWASLTSVRWDDAAVGVLEAILSSEVLSEWFSFRMTQGYITAQKFGQLPERVKAEFTAVGAAPEAVNAFLDNLAPAVLSVVSSAVSDPE